MRISTLAPAALLLSLFALPAHSADLSALSGLHIPTYADNLRMLSGRTPELLVAARRLMALMLEARLLRSPVAIDALLAPAPLEETPR